MTYSSIVEMTRSQGLMYRIAACAADEGLTNVDPMIWSQQNIWKIVSSDDGWTAAWDYAQAADNRDDFNPDTGARSDVIDDAMILAVVQPMIQAMNQPVSP